jgi:sporulation-control protein spo0M
MAFLEEFEGVVDVASDSKNKCFEIDSVFRSLRGNLEDVFDHGEALVVFLNEKNVLVG